MKYVVSRIATKNPLINGNKLFLSHIGMWTLDVERARHFDTEADAAKHSRADLETTIEQVQA